MPVIPTEGELRQEDHKLEASLGYTENSKSAPEQKTQIMQFKTK
jgi:hypothetical protein